ncbi:uncharacterized protein znf644b isoform X2 [Halichoeres trimaculatus]|uniref:uncharacterized protein znf644b isoform X2 n=1 Tax=Halichoeres trimaculatus TaxID=147232 RepID=UPI003D9DFAF4
MSDLKPNAQKDKDVDSVSVSPGRTQEPLQSHTSSLKNNAAGLSLDEHENPLNGTQPNPFVYSSVPAVPHAGNSLPSGALVNGPGSHPTSEVHCVLNKGTVLSNNVLDAAWQAEKDTSPEVLPPPSELQSDAWKNTAGPVVKTPATQPGVNTPLPHSEENESKLAYSTLSGDGAEQMHISQPLTKQTMKTRSRRGAERSESSSDDYDDAEVIRWDSAGELFSHDDRRRETKVMHQRDRKHNTHVKSVSGSAEKFQGSRRSEPGEKTAGSKPTKTIAALFADCSNKKRSFNIQKPNDRTITSSKFESLDSSKLSPSLWRVDRDGKLLLRSAEKLDTASDFTCMDAENNNCEAFGSAKQENCPANVDFSLSAKNLKLDQMLCPDNKNDCSSGSLQAKAKQNFLSTRKTLTPLHKTIDSVKSDLAPRLSQRQKKHSADWELVKGCEGSSNFLDGNTGTASFLENGENEKNLYAQRHFKKRQRFPVQDQPPRVLQGEDGGDEDCSDIEQLVIKEECTEESPRMSTSDGADVSPTQGVELKPCPYCPAMFDSGVGLSNHVRGHLHRVGLSYNARHMVSPELVAKQDHHPRIRRRTLCGAGKMKKAVKVETHGEHRCPLCRAWFETKTGLSNHVRGHLKRIGRSVTSTVKSPLSFLNELLQDQQEQQNILQVLNERRLSPRSQKFLCSKGLVLMHRRVPLKTKHEMKNPHLMLDNSQSKQENTDTEKKKSLAAMTSQSTLVELLMKRQERTGTNQETCAGRKGRKLCGPTEDYKEEPEMTRVGTTWLHDECDSKFVFRRCNHTSPLQRKRTSMFEGAGDDYKQRKLKSRPGLRKKIFSSVNAEVYTLTCRFCDLVFQGPLSIQEDWVKHLQRHLLHSSIPHSGTGMVEVLSRHHKISISMSGEHTECNPSAASD